MYYDFPFVVDYDHKETISISVKDGKYTFILKDPSFVGNIRVFGKLSPSSSTEFFSFYLGFDNTGCNEGTTNSMLRQPRFNKYIEMFEN